MPGVQMREISGEDAEQRVDRWLKRLYPQLTQGRIEKMCRKGDLRVDGGRVKPATRLEEGQSVRIPPIPDGAAPTVVSSIKISGADAKMMQASVIWKDDDIIAINKPPGLPSQGGSGHTRHIDGLSAALTFGLDEKPRLVHRLDKDTSGVLLLARRRSVAAKLTQAFQSRETRKIYWAVVAGVPHPQMGTIRYGLVKAGGHGKGGEGEKMHCIHPRKIDETPDAKRATTDYAVLSALAKRMCWIAMVPITGRTHQLRAHISELGHPILGDGKYGGSGQENLGDGWGSGAGSELGRKLHLHARSLSFEHPVTGRHVHLTAPLPEHMQQTWDFVGWDPADVPVDPFDDEA